LEIIMGRQTQKHRVPRWLAVVGSVIGLITLIGLSPLQGVAQQAILLGPDSLFPAPVPHSIVVAHDGHLVTVPVPSGLVRERLSFPSAALGGRRESYSIYLPPGYNNPSNSVRRYPVLYLLHGAPGQPSDWIHGMHVQLMEDQSIAAGTMKPMIFVMPEGNGGVWHDSQYVNTNGGFRAEDLITHDVVRYVDAHYRTIPDRRARAIAGISEGGYGAMNLGLKHLDTFGTIVSISGYFSADPTEVLVGNDPWGHNRILRAENSPMLYVSRLSGLHDTAILIMDNTGDGGYTADARRFDRALTDAHIRHTLVLQPAPNALAAHYWPYWRQAFPEALAYISRHLSS
jgi:enterochelin esterase-like enzyme